MFEAPDLEGYRLAPHLCEESMRKAMALEGRDPVIVQRLENAATCTASVQL